MAESVRINVDADSRSIQSMTRELKELKSQMVGVTDDAEFARLAHEAAEVETELKRVNNAVRELSGSGDQLPRMAGAMGGIGRSLMSLDFTAANEGAARMLAISQTMNFKSAIGSLKQLSSTFMTLGKALLTNPFFLLVAVVVAIGVALYKLMDELGLVTIVLDVVKRYFEILMIPINALIDGLKALTDWFGWTNHAGEEFAEEQIARNNELSASIEKTTNDAVGALDHEIRMRKAAGEETEELEREKLAILQASADEQLRIAEDTAKQLIITKGKDSEEYIEQMAAIEGLKEARLNASREVEVFEAKQLAEAKKRRDKEAADELAQIEKENASKAAKAKAYADQARAQREKEAAEKEALELKTAEAQRKADLMIQEERLRQNEDEIERARSLAEFKEQQAFAAIDAELLTKEQYEELERQHKARLLEIQAEADLKAEAKEKEEQEKLAVLRKEYEDAIREEKLLTEAEQAEADFETEMTRFRELLEAKAMTQEEFDELELQRKKDLQDKLDKIDEDANEKIRKDNLAENRAAVEMTSMRVGQINDIMQSFANGNEEQAKKMFNINKAANIAMAVMNTGLAVTAALTAGGNPAKLATGAQFVEAGIAGAMGAANIANIARTTFGGGGGGSVPRIAMATAPSSADTPQFNMFGQPNETGGDSSQFKSRERGQEQQPMRAYVQWSDIDETSNSNNQVLNQAQL